MYSDTKFTELAVSSPPKDKSSQRKQSRKTPIPREEPGHDEPLFQQLKDRKLTPKVMNIKESHFDTNKLGPSRISTSSKFAGASTGYNTF